MAHLKYPQWQAAFQSALLEFNTEKLARKIMRAETAIVSRLFALAGASGHHDEHVAIEQAIQSLLIVKENELAWMVWNDGSAVDNPESLRSNN